MNKSGEFVQMPIPTPNNVAGHKSLPSVSSITQGNGMFGKSWITILVIVVVLFLIYKFVLKR